jgi:hypothetical protein
MYFWSSVIGGNLVNLLGGSVALPIIGLSLPVCVLALAVFGIGLILWLAFISKDKSTKSRAIVITTAAVVVVTLIALSFGLDVPIAELGLQHSPDASSWFLRNFNFSIGGIISPTILTFFLNYYKQKELMTDAALVEKFFDRQVFSDNTPRPSRLDITGLNDYIGIVRSRYSNHPDKRKDISVYLLGLLKATPDIFRVSSAEKMILERKIRELAILEIEDAEIDKIKEGLGDVKKKIKEARYEARQNTIWSRSFWGSVLVGTWGMWTVQAEINIVLDYSKVLDGLVNPILNPIARQLDSDFKGDVSIFHHTASFVEGNPESGARSLHNVGALGWVNYGFDQIFTKIFGFNPFDMGSLLFAFKGDSWLGMFV